MAKWYEKAGHFLGDALTGGSFTARDTAREAARAQTEATNKAQQYQEQAFQEAKPYLTPYYDQGSKGYQTLSEGILGGKYDINPNDIYQTAQNDPSYKFRLQQGLDALQASAAARGGLSTTGPAIQRYAQGLASEEYGNIFDRYRQSMADRVGRLQYLAGVGQQTGANIANLRTGLGSAQAGYSQDLGNIAAAKAQGVGNANIQGINNLIKLGTKVGNAIMTGGASAAAEPALAGGQIQSGDIMEQMGPVDYSRYYDAENT